MKEVYAAYLELSKQMLLNGMRGEFEIILSKHDFDMFGIYLLQKFQYGIKQELEGDYSIKSFKVAGPGGYITFRKQVS